MKGIVRVEFSCDRKVEQYEEGSGETFVARYGSRAHMDKVSKT